MRKSGSPYPTEGMKSYLSLADGLRPFHINDLSNAPREPNFPFHNERLRTHRFIYRMIDDHELSILRQDSFGVYDP